MAVFCDNENNGRFHNKEFLYEIRGCHGGEDVVV